MLFGIYEFFHVNWQNILITLAGGTVFYILPNYTLKKIVNSAEKEKIKQARNTLLDILESRIINKQEISFEKINNLMDSISREYSIILSDITTPRSLLQDLELIFEKSHHLDSLQKDEYCKQIEEQIIKVDEMDEKLKQRHGTRQEYFEIIEKLSEEIKLNDSTKAQKTLLGLKYRILSEESLKTKRPLKSDFVVDIISAFIAIVSVLIFTKFNFIDYSYALYYVFTLAFLLGFLITLFTYLPINRKKHKNRNP